MEGESYPLHGGVGGAGTLITAIMGIDELQIGHCCGIPAAAQPGPGHEGPARRPDLLQPTPTDVIRNVPDALQT